MKTNKMLRLASILLVAAMVSTCAISGTFAKYVTSDTAGDSARVAKWGIKIVADGTLFDKTYLTFGGGNTPGNDSVEPNISVKSSNEDKLVAPGTKNTTGISFELSGTPEVDFALDVVTSFEDIVLPAGEYVDYTKGDAWTAPEAEKPKFTLANDYHPVKFTLTNGADTKVVDAGTIEDVSDALLALKGNYDAGQKLDVLSGNTNGVYKLTWEWEIEDNNAADTYLGNVMAGIVTDSNAKTNISFNVTITATQID